MGFERTQITQFLTTEGPLNVHKIKTINSNIALCNGLKVIFSIASYYNLVLPTDCSCISNVLSGRI